MRRPLGKGLTKAKTVPAIIAGTALRRARMTSPNNEGFTGPFFPPGTPLSPQAPDSTRGRRFDYSVGVNLNYQPRQQQGQANVSFELLRRFAEPTMGGLDIVRLLIERRKAQMKAQSFTIVGEEKNDDGGERAREIERILKKPDGTLGWRGWLSSVLEDHFVIDAVAVYPRLSGSRPVFDQIDGALIDVLVDDSGRRPAPPLPAFQQVLKGLPAIDYTSDELAYYVANPRPQKLYGMSPVEQMVGIITIALNRQLSVLNYFTSGSVPDMLIGVPGTWSPSQIQEFQEWWDSVLAGQLAERRHARFYPGEMKPVETKGEILKNEFDEWLARVACFCFGISPQAFVKEMNRATSESAKLAAAEEGLEPTKLFVKDVVDDLLIRVGADDLQLKWSDEEIQDPQAKATVAVMLRGGTTGSAKPVITLEEQRKMMGFAPPTADQIDELDPPEPEPLPNPNNPGDPNAPKPATDVKKAAAFRGGRSLPAVPKNRKLKQRTEKGITATVKKVLTVQRKALVAALRAKSEKLSKASVDTLAELLAELERHPWDDSVIGRLRELLVGLAKTRAVDALDHVERYMNVSDDDYRRLLEQADARAVEWARDRSGNLVQGLSEASQNFLNEMTSAAIDGGLSNGELADMIEEAYGFSPERAMTIARTETAEADSQGALIGFRESGVVSGKEWYPDAEACPICTENAADGQIGLDEVFSSGDDAPPAHPNCECDLLPVLDEAVIATLEADSGEAFDVAAD